MSDPRSDPRAHDLLSADVGEVGRLATVFGLIAHTAEQTASGLQGASNDATWQGGAADAFRAGLGKLPGDLHEVTTSYQQASDALNRYEGELSSVQPAFQALAAQLDTAQAAVTRAQTALSGAQGALNAASAKALLAGGPGMPLSSTFTAGPAPGSPLRTAVATATGAVQGAQDEFSRLCRQGYQLLDQFDTARHGARGTVSSASNVPPHRSFWDSVFHDVGNFLGGVGHFVVDTSIGIGKSIINLPGAVANFAANPSWENFGKVAEDVAVTASVVGLVATLGADAPLMEAIAGGAETLGGYGATGATVSQLAQGHYANAAVDSVFATLPEAGAPLDRAAETAKSAQTALSGYDEAMLSGAMPGEALAGMTPEARQVVAQAGPNIDEALSAANARAVQTARTARLVGAPVTFGAEHYIEDPASTKLKHMLGPEPAPCG